MLGSTLQFRERAAPCLIVSSCVSHSEFHVPFLKRIDVNGMLCPHGWRTPLYGWDDAVRSRVMGHMFGNCMRVTVLTEFVRKVCFSVGLQTDLGGFAVELVSRHLSCECFIL